MSNDTQFLKWMRHALQLANKALELGEAPIAALVVDLDREQVIGEGWNEWNARRDRIAHAEIVALHQSAGRYDLESARLMVVSTLEPCIMCMGACIEAQIKRVIWALPAPIDSGAPRISLAESSQLSTPEITGNLLADESRNLFLRWLEQHPKPGPQREYISSLIHAVRHAH